LAALPQGGRNRAARSSLTDALQHQVGELHPRRRAAEVAGVHRSGREDSGDLGTYYLAINHDEEMHRPVVDDIYTAGTMATASGSGRG
jgi:predicted amidophosphoribosyltransferase